MMNEKLIREYTDGCKWKLDSAFDIINDLPNIYIINGENVIILYYKDYKESKTFDNFHNWDRHQLRCYFDRVVIPNQLLSDSNIALYCHFCETYIPCRRFQSHCEDFGICTNCVKIKNKSYLNKGHIYVNNKFTAPNIYGKQEVNMIITLKNKIRFLYTRTYHSDMTYISLLYESWYQVNKKTPCKYCTKHQKYFNSACTQCYMFCYNTLYDLQICKYSLILEIISQTDISNIIMNIIFKILGFKDVNVAQLHPNNNNKIVNQERACLDDDCNKISNNKSLIKDESENDYTDTYQFYVQQYDNDYTGLGTWSDEEHNDDYSDDYSDLRTSSEQK